MTVAHVQNAGAVSNAVAFGSNNNAGNWLGGCLSAAADITAGSDSANGNWTKVVDEFLSSVGAADIWHFENCAAGANTFTETNGFGASFCYSWVIEASG